MESSTDEFTIFIVNSFYFQEPSIEQKKIYGCKHYSFVFLNEARVAEILPYLLTNGYIQCIQQDKNLVNELSFGNEKKWNITDIKQHN